MENVLCRTSLFLQFITLLALEESDIVIGAIHKASRCAPHPPYASHHCDKFLINNNGLVVLPTQLISYYNFGPHNFCSSVIVGWVFMSSIVTFTPTEGLESPPRVNPEIHVTIHVTSRWQSWQVIFY